MSGEERDFSSPDPSWVDQAQAIRRLEMGDPRGAIEFLKRALGHSPENPGLHTLLALALLETKRLHAAELEAGISLDLDPEYPIAHRIMASVQLAKRNFSKAREHGAQSLALDPNDAQNRLMQARILQAMNKKEEAKTELEMAISLAPEDPNVHEAMGDHCRHHGDPKGARKFYQAALELEPEHFGSLVGMGYVLLLEGKVEEARDHAIWALSHNPTNEEAIGLITAIKARKSPFMGLWWRFNAWLVGKGEVRAMVTLMILFVLYRIGSQVLLDLGQEDASVTLRYLWLGFAVYTWVAPGYFQRQIQAELREVQLKPGF